MPDIDDKKISDVYRKAASEQPPSALDQRILAAAHAREPKNTGKVSTSPFSSNWVVPLSLAATVLLTISVVMTIPDADFQRTSELDYVAPRSADEQSAGSVAEKENNLMAKAKKQARKKTGEMVAPAKNSSALAEAPAVRDESGKVSSLTRGDEVRAREVPESLALRSVPAESKQAAKPAAPAPAMKLKNKVPEKSLRREGTKPGYEAFRRNLKNIKTGDDKIRVRKLLGKPDLEKPQLWQYQYHVNGKTLDYTIRFRENQVIKIESPK